MDKGTEKCRILLPNVFVLMVGLQYYVNCVRMICVYTYTHTYTCVYPRYTYNIKTFSRQNILYDRFRAQEPHAMNNVMNDRIPKPPQIHTIFPSYTPA